MESSLDKYLAAHCSLRDCEALKWIEHQTHLRTNYARMLSGPVQGSLLKLLVELSGAKRILEIGTFTGYSSVCMALGLPEGGHIDALELNDELEDLIREGWKRAGVADKIELHLGDAKETLSQLSASYDLAFIDANKREYALYYELTLPLLRRGGLIVVDDVLWDSKVYAEKPERDAQTRALVEFNESIASDLRVESVIVPLRDGLTLIRKK